MDPAAAARGPAPTGGRKGCLRVPCGRFWKGPADLPASIGPLSTRSGTPCAIGWAKEQSRAIVSRHRCLFNELPNHDADALDNVKDIVAAVATGHSAIASGFIGSGSAHH